MTSEKYLSRIAELIELHAPPGMNPDMLVKFKKSNGQSSFMFDWVLLPYMGCSLWVSPSEATCSIAWNGLQESSSTGLAVATMYADVAKLGNILQAFMSVYAGSIDWPSTS